MLELKKRPKSPFYYARGTINGKRVEVSTGCLKLADARKKLPAILAELSANQDGEERLTFVTALEIYKAKRPDARFLEALERHFGSMLVADIDSAEMRRAAAALYPGRADATIRRQLYTPIKAIINSAAEEGRCRVPLLKAPTGGNKRTVFMLPDEADRLLVELTKNQNAFLAPMVTMLIGQGIRMSEAVTLQARDVSLEHRFAILRETKNGEERRVSLIPRVVAALSRLPSLGAEGPLFRRFDGYGFRFGKNSGGQIQKAFAKAVTDAKLDPERITPHVCRHTWATWFYAQTKDVRRLQDEGGWKSNEWQRYTKLGTPDLGRSVLRAGWDFRPPGENRGKRKEKSDAARA